MNGERMHAARQLVGERGVDHAMTLDPALSTERFRHDIETEVSLAARAMPSVTFMAVRFIFDVQAFGRESLTQLFGDKILPSHGFVYDARFCRLSSLAGAIGATA